MSAERLQTFVRLMLSVPLDAGQSALGSKGVIILFAVGLVIAP